jgi:3',5'-cyclic AMP phosphodiesterase CpdA
MGVPAGADPVLGAGVVPPRPRSIVLRVLGAVLALVVVAAAIGFLQYRRQVIAYLTHLRGSPSHTEPYVAFPADDPPELRIAVAGDIGDSGSRIDATGEAMARLPGDKPFDVLLLLGDNVYPSGDPAKLPETVFGPFADVLDRGADLFAILGNHDVSRGDEQLDALGMPGHWWAEERGDVLLIGLDSNEVADPDQRAFLEETLRGSTVTWKIVAVHHPPYSAGYQGSSEETRAAFAPLFEEHGVQLVLSGHDHDYQRSKEINGVTYVVTGAAAGTRRTGKDDFTEVSFSWHSYVELGVYPDHLVGRVMNQDNRVADEWVLQP